MKVYNKKEIDKVMKRNGFIVKRQSGSHQVWWREIDNRTIILKVQTVNRMIWQRLVKENNLKCDF